MMPRASATRGDPGKDSLSIPPPHFEPTGNRISLFLAAAAGMFLFGVVLAILGTLFGLPQMRERLQVQMAEEGDLFLLLFAGVFLASLATGALIDRAGNKPVFVISALLVALGLAGMALATSFAGAAAGALVLGTGGGGLNTASNALVSDLSGRGRGRMLNLLNISYGVGALAVPLLVASLGNEMRVRRILFGCAAASVVAALTYWLLPFPSSRESRRWRAGEFLRMAGAPGVLLLGTILFFQSGNESAMGGWTSAYLGTLGANARTATWVLSCYWAGMILGRGMAAGLLGRMEKKRLILLSGAGAFAGSLLMILAPNLSVAVAAAALTGLSFAAVYPTTLAIAGDQSSRSAGTIFGMLFAMGLLGGMSVPWAIGQVGDAWGLRAGMHLPLFTTAMIAILAGVLLLREQPR